MTSVLAILSPMRFLVMMNANISIQFSSQGMLFIRAVMTRSMLIAANLLESILLPSLCLKYSFLF